MKHNTLYLTLLLIIFSLPASAQRDYTADSIAFVNADWHSDTLDGFRFMYHHFMHRQVFNSNQYFSVIEVPSGSLTRFKFVSDSILTTVADFATRTNAIAAINGSYFDMRSGIPVCYLRIDSVELGENTPGKDTVNRKYYQYGTLCLSHDSVFILKTDSSRHWEEALPYPDIMTAGPLLIWHDTLQHMRNDRTFVTNRHNRTAVGIRDDGTVLLLVADGRHKQAEGLSLTELQQIFRWLGCRDALNLDGGGSTTLFLNIGDYQGIANCPSDNGRFDTAGQRRVANAIVITPALSKKGSEIANGNKHHNHTLPTQQEP